MYNCFLKKLFLFSGFFPAMVRIFQNETSNMFGWTFQHLYEGHKLGSDNSSVTYLSYTNKILVALEN